MKKILILLLLITNNTYSGDTSFISGFGSNIHDANRKAMNVVRAHKLQVVGGHTQISSDGTAMVIMEVKSKKINKADVYAKDDRHEN